MMDRLLKEYYCQVWQIFKIVKLKEQDHSYQHLSCTSPSLHLLNSQVVKKGNSEERSKKERASNVNTHYIKRQSGGCGLVELESAYDAAIGSLCEYIKQGQEKPTRLVQEYDAKKTKHSLQKKANQTKQNI
jgi:DNA mismatch repair ATPase MutS